ERDNPCHTSYFYNKKKGQNILASNIGVTVKKGTNSSYFIAVNNLLDTAPISNASVSLFNYQQQQIQTKKTNEKGHVFINSNTNAYFAIVSHNGQKTYVKLNDGNTLSVSKFDVAGVRLQKGLKGFIYGERGVWRPGDDIYLSFMLHDKANPLPANHPVKIELIDPYGKVVEQLVKKKSVDKVYNFHMGTDSEAPTGNYTAKVTVGGVQFTKTIKIETIKPN
ncbi:MAG: MG2 domain-containing protein, partial [Flavobacteriaceae bacterium]|nr:MG2 domain-containing protein [Flavobacteriaceae bacterium]